METEPLKGKIFQRSYKNPNLDEHARVCLVDDINSAVEYFKERLIEAGIHQHKPISVVTFNKIYAESFPDLNPEPLSQICKCGHSFHYHDTLDNHACHLMDCKCKGFERQ